MNKLNMKTISLMVAGAFVLTGCAATREASERYKENNQGVSKKYSESLEKDSVASAISDISYKSTNFGKSTRNWVDPVPLPRVEPKVKLPELFKKDVSITIPGVTSAPEILLELRNATGLNITASPDVHDTNGGQGKIISATSGDAGGSTKPSLLLLSDFVYRGTLENALDALAAKANISWKWTGTEINFYRFETKTYNIAALAGSTKTASNVDLKGDTSGSAASGGGSSAANAGSSSSNVSRSASLTTWDEVKTFLVAQLSPNGTMAVLESTGAVTIKDLPSIHKNLNKSINDLNALLTKQIFLNVDIYSVSTSGNDQAGVDWNLVWAKQSAKHNYGYESTAGGVDAMPNQLSIGVLKGPFKGTSVMLGALSTVGKTSIVNQFQVTTLNGQPTPIASNKKVGYLKEVSVTEGSGENVAPKYELKAGEISAGINLNIIPKIEPSGNILVEYTMNLSDIEGIRTFTAPNGSSIEIPTSNLKSVLQRASLRSGQTLVLSGFKQAGSHTNKSGVGTPSNILMSGKHDSGTSDQYLVITVTPYIANNNSEFGK